MGKEKPTTKVCKHCKTEIPYGAKVCPQCRKKQGGALKWVIIAIVAICVIGAATGGGDEKPKEVSNTNNETNAKQEEKDQKESKSEESKQESEESSEEDVSNIFYAGDVLETKKVRLSYLSCGEYSDSNAYVKPGDGNKYIYLEFEFENIGDTDTSVGSFDFKCYADGYEVKSPLITADNSLIAITSLSPGRKASGIIVFEVPQNAESIEVEYETSFWTQDKAIFVYE